MATMTSPRVVIVFIVCIVVIVKNVVGCEACVDMKIAVCIKQVVTREWQLRVAESGTWIRDSDASFELNEPDAYALEEALRLKEKHSGEVVVCSAGPARAAQVIREALARGADRAIHVESDALATADAFTVATALADAIRDEKFDLVLTGLQSDDQGFGQVGVVLAETLGMPHSTIIMEVQAAPSTGSGQGPSLRVKRELEGGLVPVGVAAPAGAPDDPERHQSAPIRHAQGDHGRQEEGDSQGHARRRSASRSSASSACTSQRRRRQTQMIAGSAAEAAKTLVAKLRDEARVL